VDATGLEAHPAHVSAVQLRFLPGDRLKIQFTFEGNGRSVTATGARATVLPFAP